MRLIYDEVLREGATVALQRFAVANASFFRRREQSDLASDESVLLPERALKRLLRMMFAANRCHWLSATELCIFMFAEDVFIESNSGLPLFTSRLFFQSQQGKRFLNNGSA